jgi:hemerythrin
MNSTMTSALIEWRDEYLIGVEELDHEHKDLIKRLNDLHDELANCDEKAEVEYCLAEIHIRVAAHFALEERYMSETKFKNYTEHKKEHDDFLEIIVDLIEKFRSDPELSYGTELEKQLQHWIVYHIVASDHELATGNKAIKK